MAMDMIGHNAAGITITIEARFFNSLARYSGTEGLVRRLHRYRPMKRSDL